MGRDLLIPCALKNLLISCFVFFVFQAKAGPGPTKVQQGSPTGIQMSLTIGMSWRTVWRSYHFLDCGMTTTVKLKDHLFVKPKNVSFQTHLDLTDKIYISRKIYSIRKLTYQHLNLVFIFEIKTLIALQKIAVGAMDSACSKQCVFCHSLLP